MLSQNGAISEGTVEKNWKFSGKVFENEEKMDMTPFSLIYITQGKKRFITTPILQYCNYVKMGVGRQLCHYFLLA